MPLVSFRYWQRYISHARSLFQRSLSFPTRSAFSAYWSDMQRLEATDAPTATRLRSLKQRSNLLRCNTHWSSFNWFLDEREDAAIVCDRTHRHSVQRCLTCQGIRKTSMLGTNALRRRSIKRCHPSIAPSTTPISSSEAGCENFF